MPKFTAVMGKSKTNRIVSIEAPTEDRARYLIHQQLGTNAQRREIRDQWVADGEHITVDDPQNPTPEFGPQEPPGDPMIYNRRQADGTFRLLRGFFDREDEAQANSCTRSDESRQFERMTPEEAEEMGVDEYGYEEAPFDEALANARIRVKLQALLTELALRATRIGSIPESGPVFYAIDDAREALTAYERRSNA